MRLCLVMSSLGPGGAERVAANLVNEWVRAGHGVSVVTLAPADLDFYWLDHRIDRRGLGLTADSNGFFSGALANLRRLRALRLELGTIRPDVIVSFIDRTNVLTLTAAAGLGIPVVVSERVDPRMFPLGRLWEVLRRLTYPLAGGLVVQTDSVAEWAHRIVDSRRVAVIPNPVSESCLQIGRRAAAETRVRRVVALGRLVTQKGFDRLIDAFDGAAAGRPDWSLVIAGDGPLDGVLRAQAGRTRCADRIEFAGLLGNPEELLAESEIFVLSSRFEGFPNALVEAMACGCSVIATDCPSGPADIVTNGVDGVLVSVDGEGLAGSLEALMEDAGERRRLGRAAAASVERLRVDRIADQWIGLLASVSARAAAAALSPADEPRFVPER